MGLLDDIIIVDFTSRLPGPLATHVLADEGALIYKIESLERPDPFNDPQLHLVSPAFRDWYKQLNMHKKIVTIDFFDKKKVHSYINHADVVIYPDNQFFKDFLKDKQPKVSVKIAAGVNEYKSMHDLNAIAMTETFKIHLEDSQRPPYLPFAGINFGVCIAQKICSGLIKHLKTKKDISLTVTLKDMTSLVFDCFNSDSFNHTPQQLHNGLLPSYTLYQTKDGHHVALAAVEQKYWDKFLALFDLSLESEDRYNTSQIIFQKIQNKFASLTLNEISNIIGGEEICLTQIK